MGASPGASVSVNIILEIVEECFGYLLKTEEGLQRLKNMIPSYKEDLIEAEDPRAEVDSARDQQRTTRSSATTATRSIGG